MHNMPIASLTEHFLFAMAVVLPAPRRARPRGAGPFTSARRLSGLERHPAAGPCGLSCRRSRWQVRLR